MHTTFEIMKSSKEVEEMHEDIFVYHVPLPDGVNEMVTPCLDGYTLYLDDSLTYEKRLEEYRHAVGEHVEKNQFEDADVQKIETKAHGKNY